MCPYFTFAMEWFSLQIHNSKNYQKFTVEDITADINAVIGMKKAGPPFQDSGTLSFLVLHKIVYLIPIILKNGLM